ncbi:hypothetical protein GE061_007256 [Apolygus lucorum]|uniref:Uncharacterized protein n=1 Tax=Apolygus lucorum TaxID=248454 RepID=A0A8S9WSZ2_APOLU|nr:hypothetical protein GE061_007256 [Apolygus lucorum]
MELNDALLMVAMLVQVSECVTRKFLPEDEDLMIVEVETWDNAPPIRHVIRGRVSNIGNVVMYNFVYESDNGEVCVAVFVDNRNLTGKQSFHCRMKKTNEKGESGHGTLRPVPVWKSMTLNTTRPTMETTQDTRLWTNHSHHDKATPNNN